MKKEYHIKCGADSQKFIISFMIIYYYYCIASYKIIKGMRMEIEQLLANKSGILNHNVCVSDL